MTLRVITLLTDFGTADAYVGAMKGAILSVCPQAQCLDITHEIPPQDVLVGALTMLQYVPYYPSEAVHLAVVDPGVGTRRLPMIVQTGRGYLVGPDNGLLSLAFTREGLVRAVNIENEKLIGKEVSPTFHGRDVFGPAAAHLFSGVALEEFGGPIDDPVSLELPPPVLQGGVLETEIIHIDHFGNAITGLSRECFNGFSNGNPPVIEVADRVIDRICTTYGNCSPGETLALFGSFDYLEIAVANGGAARRLGLKPGDTVRLRNKK